MNTGARRSNGVLGVHRVRQGDVDSIDGSEAFVKILVAEGLVKPIACDDFPTLRAVAADNCSQAGASSHVGERRKDCDLRDVS